MSNTETNRVITIGLKYSDRTFVIKESNVEEDRFIKFVDKIEKAMNNKLKGFSIIDKDDDFLYLDFESIAYIEMIDENNNS